MLWSKGPERSGGIRKRAAWWSDEITDPLNDRDDRTRCTTGRGAKQSAQRSP
jgi:hypothetical protein